MDSTRFDALARTLFAATTRRTIVAVLLGAGFAGVGREARARRKKRQSRRGASRVQRRRTSHERKAQPAGAEAARCCSTGNCAPGKGKNLGKCCYQGQDLTGKTFSGANLGSANFARATLTKANVQGANLGKACLVDADLTGIKANASTNLGTAIYCRTRTDSGLNDSGCDQGTPCCPTCDAANPCVDGFVCCAGRCLPGDCCDNGQQSTCALGELCCGNRCAVGGCCAAADCPAQTCQRKSCRDRQCAYEPVTGGAGPRCQTVCCDDESGEPTCCPEGTTGCDADNRCGCRAGQGCGADQVCCAGACRRGDCCVARDCGSSANTCADFRCACGAAPACAPPTPHCCGPAAQAICRECCADAQCANPAAPFCLDFQCVDADAVQIFERVRAVVSLLLDIPEDAITMQSDFVRDLGADSLDLVEIIIALEEEFDLTITDEQLEQLDIRTVGDVVRGIDDIKG